MPLSYNIVKPICMDNIMENTLDLKINYLENGLKLVTVKKDIKLFSLNIGIKVGAVYESLEEKGISHLIEHMIFKGTNSKDSETLNEELEFLGGEYNAYTDYISTVFNVEALNEELENSISLFSDMIMNSSINEEELKKEKSIILSEIRINNDDVEETSFNIVNEIGFLKSPLKYDVMGTEETVRSFSRKKVYNYYKKYYIPQNSFIVLVSSKEHIEALNIVKNYFNGWTGYDFNYSEPICEKNINKIKTCYKENMEQCTITYLYTFYGLTKDEELALRVLNHKLGQSSNSILFRELREKHGLSYDVYTYIDTSKYLKTLYIYASVSKDEIKKAKSLIDDIIIKVKNDTKLFNERTFTLIKKTMKTSITEMLEDYKGLSSYIIGQLLNEEDIYEIYSELKDIENLTEDNICQIARKVLVKPTISILSN